MKSIIKKYLIIGTMSLFVFSLTACSLSSPKEAFTVSYLNFNNATSYEYTSKIDMNISLDGELNPQEEQILNSLNDAKLSIDGKSDIVNNQHEATAHLSVSFSPLSFNIDLPFYLDGNTQKIYVKTDSLVKNFGNFVPIPKEIEGKLIELDGGQKSEHLDQQQLQDFLKNETQQLLSKLSKDKFIDLDISPEDKANNVSRIVKVSFGDSMVKEFTEKMTLKAIDIFGETVPQNELDTFKKQLNENLTINEFTVISYMNKETQIVKEEYIFDITTTDNEMNGNFTLEIANEYKNINLPITFTIDPAKEDVIHFNELNSLLH